jgi:hypothetical protein
VCLRVVSIQPDTTSDPSLILLGNNTIAHEDVVISREAVVEMSFETLLNMTAQKSN